VDAIGVQVASPASARGTAVNTHLAAHAPDVESAGAEPTAGSPTRRTAIPAGVRVVRVIVQPAGSDSATGPVARRSAINTIVVGHRIQGSGRSVVGDETQVVRAENFNRHISLLLKVGVQPIPIPLAFHTMNIDARSSIGIGFAIDVFL